MDSSKDRRTNGSPQGIERRVVVEAINSRSRDGKPKMPAGENADKKWEPPKKGTTPSNRGKRSLKS